MMMHRRTHLLHLVATTSLLLTASTTTATATATATTTSSKEQGRRLATTENGFDAFDTDHNGYIDRSEYNVAVSRFQNSLLQGFSGGNGGATTASGATASAAAVEQDSKNSNAANAQTQQIMSPIINQALSSLNNNNSNNKNKSSYSSSKDSLKFWPAFVNSLSMIIATEIGDKTFFIAAVLSMKNDRLAVFGGAILALIVMTILSSMMGLVLPSILPRKYTHIIGGILFLYFGIKLLIDSRSIAEGKCSDELEEVEEELMQHSSKKDDNDVDDEESGNIQSTSTSSKKKSNNQSNAATKVFVQALTMTFLAEWGDRSQIATIALAAAKDPFGVNVGGILGHSLCTGMAVIGGRMLAARIEERTVTKWSGVTFLLFGAHSLFFE